MGLRTLKIAAGGDAGAAETDLMVREKIKAAAELQTLALTGGLGLTPPRAASKTLKTIGGRSPPFVSGSRKA